MCVYKTTAPADSVLYCSMNCGSMELHALLGSCAPGATKGLRVSKSRRSIPLVEVSNQFRLQPNGKSHWLFSSIQADNTVASKQWHLPSSNKAATHDKSGEYLYIAFLKSCSLATAVELSVFVV